MELATARDLECVQAIALAYVRAKAPNVLPLIGGRRVEHLQDNIKGLEIDLTAEEVELLESKMQFDVGFPADFIGQDWKLTGKPPAMVIAQGPLVLKR